MLPAGEGRVFEGCELDIDLLQHLDQPQSKPLGQGTFVIGLDNRVAEFHQVAVSLQDLGLEPIDLGLEIAGDRDSVVANSAVDDHEEEDHRSETAGHRVEERQPDRCDAASPHITPPW